MIYGIEVSLGLLTLVFLFITTAGLLYCLKLTIKIDLSIKRVAKLLDVTDDQISKVNDILLAINIALLSTKQKKEWVETPGGTIGIHGGDTLKSPPANSTRFKPGDPPPLHRNARSKHVTDGVLNIVAPKLSKRTRKIAGSYKRGATILELAGLFRISRSGIRYHLKKAGVIR